MIPLQAFTTGALFKVMEWMKPHLSQLLLDYPLLKEDKVVFLDAGCGIHLPGMVAALSQGWQAIGVEVEEHRICFAAEAVLDLLLTPFGANLDLGLFHKDISRPMNLSGVHVIFCWDKVRTT